MDYKFVVTIITNLVLFIGIILVSRLMRDIQLQVDEMEEAIERNVEALMIADIIARKRIENLENVSHDVQESDSLKTPADISGWAEWENPENANKPIVRPD